MLAITEPNPEGALEMEMKSKTTFQHVESDTSIEDKKKTESSLSGTEYGKLQKYQGKKKL